MHRIAELLFYCSVGNLKAVKKLVRSRSAPRAREPAFARAVVTCAVGVLTTTAPLLCCRLQRRT
jgi:hypothetical protein